MKIITFLTLSVTNLIILQNTFSQTKINLDEAISIAIENNHQIKSARLEIEKETAIKLKSFNIPRPQLFAEYEGVKNNLNNSESRKLGVIQELEFPTNYFLRSDVQNSQIRITQEELNQKLNDLRASVKTNYYNLLLQLRLLETAEEILKVYDDFFLAAQKKYDVGESSNLEVLGAKINKIKIENEIKNVESEIRSSQSELKNLLGVNYYILPAEELTYSELQLSKPELLTKAISNNPDIKIIKYRKEKFSNQLSLAKGELLPNFSFSYYRQRLGNDNGFWGLELGLGIPFWFWGEQTGNIKESNYEFKIASNDEISTKKSLENDLNKSFESYENSLRQLRFFKEEAIKETEEIFRQAKISYDQGAIGYVEYLQVLAIVYETRTQFLKAIYNYNQSIINLEKITAGEIK